MAFVFVLMMFDASVPPPEIASVVAPDTDTETAKAEIAVLSLAVTATGPVVAICTAETEAVVSVATEFCASEIPSENAPPKPPTAIATDTASAIDEIFDSSTALTETELAVMLSCEPVITADT